MSYFGNAFERWLASAKRGTLTEIATESGVDASSLSRISKGKMNITFDSLKDLLPAIERHSDRATVAHLLECHLRDEIPEGYEKLIHLTPDHGTLQETPEDPLDALFRTWKDYAQRNAQFRNMIEYFNEHMVKPAMNRPQ